MSDNLGSIEVVSVSKVKPNMLLAEDVITKSGVVIMAKNTMINNINYSKLMDNEIESVKVWTASIEHDSEEFMDIEDFEDQSKPVVEREEYKEFEKTYELKIDVVKEKLVAVGSGNDVDIDDLYNTTNEIFNAITCKSDLLSYLSHLRKSDDHTFAHCINVSLLCNLFSRWIGMSEEEGKLLTVAGVLHDVGKTKVDPVVLNKEGKLTNEEYEIVKKHSYLGYKMVEKSDLPEEIKSAVLMHHEKIDGSGYPMGLKGDKISKFAKIVCICDIYDAMTSNRVYRDKICPFDVIRSFEKSSLGVLDTEYLLIFLQNIAYTYVGSMVELSDGRTAEVVFINSANLSMPIVKCDDSFMDLSQTSDITIDHII